MHKEIAFTSVNYSHLSVLKTLINLHPALVLENSEVIDNLLHVAYENDNQ